MAVTSYHTVNGRIRGESTGGARTGYVPDALGSVTATTDEAGSVVNSYRYKPYGELLAKTGAVVDPKFLWIGVLGIRSDATEGAGYYARRRSYGSRIATWTTVDVLWPSEPCYDYSRANPTSRSDAFGLQPTVISGHGCENCKSVCGYQNMISPLEEGIKRFCDAYKDTKDGSARSCIDACLSKWGHKDGVIGGCIDQICSNPFLAIKCSKGGVPGEPGSCEPRPEFEYDCPAGCANKKYNPVALADTTCFKSRGNYFIQIRICCYDPNRDLDSCCCPYDSNPRMDESGCAQARDNNRIIASMLHEISHACGGAGESNGCFQHEPIPGIMPPPWKQDCFAECANKCFRPPLYSPPKYEGKCN